jgi:hypothetical protein
VELRHAAAPQFYRQSLLQIVESGPCGSGIVLLPVPSPARISVRDAKQPPTLLKFRMRAIPIWSDAVPVQKIVKVKS